MTLAARPRSDRVVAMLAYLLAREDGAFAHELAAVASLRTSRAVYPMLQWWIRRGVVEVVKVAGYNLYRIAGWARQALEHILRVLLRSREVVAVRLAVRVAESRLWRRLRPAERELVALLAERLLSTSRYLRVRGESVREALDALRAKIEERMRARGASFHEISEALMNLDEAIDELREAGVLYAHWDRRNRHLVLRLDKSLEEDLWKILGRMNPRGR